MAEIRYSGVPTQATPGVGAGLQEKWAQFALADLPMGLIKGAPIPGAGGNRKQLIAALLKLLQEEEAAGAAGAAGATGGVVPSFIPGVTPAGTTIPGG